MKQETKYYCGHTTYCDCGPEETKQETLEEAAENSFLANKLENSNAVEKAHYIAGFRECAKWQQEQIGKSEFLQKLRGTMSDAEARRLILEQFKKK